MGLLRYRKTIIGFGIVVWIVSAGVLVRQYIRARSVPASSACVNNLRQIQGAKEEWALENHKTSNDVVTWQDVQPYMGRGPNGTLPMCPQGGTYILGRVGQPPRCSYGGDHVLD